MSFIGVAVAAGVGGAVSGGIGLLGNRGKTVSQGPMLTEEQKKAMSLLLGIGQNGGDAYTGNQGDYTQTGTQQLSGNKLYDLINGGNPAGYDTARTTLTGLANNKFNPDDPSSGFAAYSRELARATGNQNDILNRESAITGDRFSTSIGRNKSDLMAQQSDQLGSKLGDLYNTAQDRSYNAANALGNLETQQSNNTRSNIAAGFDANQGGLQNTLNNAQAQFQYNEFKRQQMGKMDALKGVLGANTNIGVASVTGSLSNPFAPAINAFGSKLGDAAGNKFSSLFNNITPKPTMTPSSFSNGLFKA